MIPTPPAPGGTIPHPLHCGDHSGTASGKQPPPTAPRSTPTLVADVTSIEASRSTMEVLDDLSDRLRPGAGPGVWDIHSPRVPSGVARPGQALGVTRG
ncbi:MULTISPECIES: hypothetical protein [Micromonospora]|uniref:hypothetical protein n=1 Tax=Micromonospora TaxID=1873 RepID=UPI00031694DE|nr:hypothetical protein [Micromonospora maris]